MALLQFIPAIENLAAHCTDNKMLNLALRISLLALLRGFHRHALSTTLPAAHARRCDFSAVSDAELVAARGQQGGDPDDPARAHDAGNPYDRMRF